VIKNSLRLSIVPFNICRMMQVTVRLLESAVNEIRVRESRKNRPNNKAGISADSAILISYKQSHRLLCIITIEPGFLFIPELSPLKARESLVVSRRFLHLFLVPISLGSARSTAKVSLYATNVAARIVNTETEKRQRSLHVRLLDGCSSH